MTVIEREGKWINFYWNAESQIKKALWYGFEIAKEPHFDSYSKIGLYMCRFDTSNSRYGKWVLGLHYGRYLLEFSFKNGFKFYNDYMDVNALNSDIPNTSPGEFE